MCFKLHDLIAEMKEDSFPNGATDASAKFVQRIYAPFPYTFSRKLKNSLWGNPLVICCICVHSKA